MKKKTLPPKTENTASGFFMSSPSPDTLAGERRGLDPRALSGRAYTAGERSAIGGALPRFSFCMPKHTPKFFCRGLHIGARTFTISGQLHSGAI